MKKLMLSTALVAVTSIPAFAESTEGMFRAEADPQEIHASDFIGMRVYRADKADAAEYEGVQDSWDDIGEINDVILTRDGSVGAVLVDIGGFLGMGENQVAVEMDSIRFVSDGATADDDSDFFLVLNAPRERLEEAPAYKMPDERPAAAAEAEAEVNAEAAEAEAEITEEAAEAAEAVEQGAEEAVAETSETLAEAGEAVDGDVMTRAPIARDGYAVADETELTAERLTGTPAYDANDEWIGEVSELLLTDDGKVKSVVVDVGGFLGIGEKPVELEMQKIDILRADDGSDLRVYISMTEDEMKSLPDYDS
ncbi:PRC-barrel domain-containing protein [Leisingera methylohalidivorans]|uniref:PRC-barrel domain-containing protein n=1 Tax=Leisingera methylohalidivorans DSM 14336 TaxID=999552 RepID=V9VRI6_9RHOB|nr:PRC-barrel domain-containing protein [Leisingera methylohalidivorans]AHC99476.1 hypothetical protein METH_01060 [Leisingera methylohalidivorans DSM 14336]